MALNKIGLVFLIFLYNLIIMHHPSIQNLDQHRPRSVRYVEDQDRPMTNTKISSNKGSSFAQYKSATVLPRNNQASIASSKILSPGTINFKSSQNNANLYPSFKSFHHIKQQKIKQNPLIDKKHGYIYKSSSNLLQHKHRTESEESQIQKLENQNAKLRSKLIDCELRQRQNIEKINNLQKFCVKLEELVAKRKTMTKQQQQLLTVLKSTFFQCFGIEEYKQIWQMQKHILHEWMNSKIEEKQLLKEKKKSENQIKQTNEEPEIVGLESSNGNIKSDNNIRIKIERNKRTSKIKSEQGQSSQNQ